jgi:hypothetical protein
MSPTGRERSMPRRKGITQKVQAWLHPYTTGMWAETSAPRWAWGKTVAVAAATPQKVNQRTRVGGRRENVHVREGGLKFVITLDADQAAHQVDDFIGVFALQRVEGREPAIGFILGGLAHDAGVQHDDVRRRRVARGLVAEFFQLGGDALRVGFVHLAAGGADEVLHSTEILPQSPGKLAGGVLAPACNLPASAAVSHALLCRVSWRLALQSCPHTIGELTISFIILDCKEGEMSLEQN